MYIFRPPPPIEAKFCTNTLPNFINIMYQFTLPQLGTILCTYFPPPIELKLCTYTLPNVSDIVYQFTLANEVLHYVHISPSQWNKFVQLYPAQLL